MTKKQRTTNKSIDAILTKETHELGLIHELDLATKKIVRQERRKGVFSPFSGNFEKLEIVYSHYEKYMKLYRRDRRFRWYGMCTLEFLRCCLAVLSAGLMTNAFCHLIDTVKKEHRFFFNKEHEFREKIQRLELVLKLRRSRDNMDEMP